MAFPSLTSPTPTRSSTCPPAPDSPACMDKDIWRKGWHVAVAPGAPQRVRCDLGPQIDVYSNPIGCRLNGSVSRRSRAEPRLCCGIWRRHTDPTWGDDEATDDQGTEQDSVLRCHAQALRRRGCPEGGRNDHTDSGKWSVFPGGSFQCAPGAVPRRWHAPRLSKTEQADCHRALLRN